MDLKKAEDEFIRYTNQYDKMQTTLERKFYHSFRVEELCGRIAYSLKMNHEQIALAKLIGLLHDIGRFEQYTIYGTLSDRKSIDHGDLGVAILEKNDYIRQYIEKNQYDEIIKKAIHNHNKFAIEDGLSDEEDLFCKIIRDADKLDIFWEATTIFWKGEEETIGKQLISEEVFRQIMQKQIVRNQDGQTNLDSIIKIIAFIYDLHFKASYEIMIQNDYINQMMNRFSYQNEITKQRMEQIRKQANEYLQNKKEES